VETGAGRHRGPRRRLGGGNHLDIEIGEIRRPAGGAECRSRPGRRKRYARAILGGVEEYAPRGPLHGEAGGAGRAWPGGEWETAKGRGARKEFAAFRARRPMMPTASLGPQARRPSQRCFLSPPRRGIKAGATGEARFIGPSRRRPAFLGLVAKAQASKGEVPRRCAAPRASAGGKPTVRRPMIIRPCADCLVHGRPAW